MSDVPKTAMTEQEFQEFVLGKELGREPTAQGALNIQHPQATAMLIQLVNHASLVGNLIDQFRKEMFYGGHTDPEKAVEALAVRLAKSECDELQPRLKEDEDFQALTTSYLDFDPIELFRTLMRPDENDMTLRWARQEGLKFGEPAVAGRVLHATLGQLGDAVELVYETMNLLLGGDDDSLTKVSLELGDNNFWLTMATDAFGLQPGVVRARVARKLNKRHEAADGFDVKTGKEGARDYEAENEAAKREEP